MGKRTAAEVGPEPPKRSQSGYGLFVSAKREEITATLLKEGVDRSKILVSVSKRAGELWKALAEATRAPYNKKAETLMATYTQQMEAFKESNPEFKKVKKLKRGEAEKPPARPLGAYSQWIAENRPMLTEKVMKEHNVDKAKAFIMLYKESKSLYEAVPATEKKKIEEKVEVAKAKFQVEFKAWKDSAKENGNSPSKGKNTTKGADKGPKRPLGAYAMWIAENRPMLTEKVMEKLNVDKAKAFLMLYKESKSLYEAVPATEKKKVEEKAAVALVKFKAERDAWKLKNKGAKADEGEGEGEDDDDGEEAESP